MKKITLPPSGKRVSLAEIESICRNFGLNELWKKIKRRKPKKPFRCNGCSYWSDSWNGISMYPACFFHDLKYWVGGTEIERLVADAELMIDVAKLGLLEMGQIMFFGVRAGGKKAWRKSYKRGKKVTRRK